jgi:crotonobetainyl-CoA:carnitine CoA-transferase CaiB-like acyl-CoA transferase
MDAETTGVFSGLRVIDCASFIAGPAAATILSDFGADVIKIEPPGAGDPYRALPSMPGNPVSTENYAWLMEGRNKRSLALDLKSAAGQAVLQRLVATADVFVTNLPQPVRTRLAIAPHDLLPANPRLIYAALSAYGEVGEEAAKTGFDSTAYWARSGLMDQVRPHAESPPARSVAGMGDHPTATALYGAIVTALYRRERTGLGGLVGTSLLANGLWSNAYLVQASICGAVFTPRPPREQAPNALANLYCCADARWFLLALVNEERQWTPFLKVIGQEAWATDPRFIDKPSRRANAAALMALLDGVFATRRLAEWRAMLDAASLTFGIVGTLDEAARDPQAIAAGVLRRFEGEDLLTVDSPIHLDGPPKTTPRRPPEVGQHSAAILAEAGFGAAEVAQLRQAGVVA